MELNPLGDYLHFIMNTFLLVLGSILLTVGLNLWQPPFPLGVVIPNQILLFGGGLIVFGLFFGGFWCYTFLNKTMNESAEGGYICPRCQSMCHPDATRCWFCFCLLDISLEQIIISQSDHFDKENTVGTCCVCGGTGNYYRKGRWFCFEHRILGR